jgi:hypothetical protein
MSEVNHPPLPVGPDPINAESVVLEALRLAHQNTGAARYLRVYEQLHQIMARNAAATTHSARHTMQGPAEAERIRIVCATRKDRESFYTETALGKSLALYWPPAVDIRLFSRNTRGLSAVYNSVICECRHDPAILLFIHDDIHLCDYFWSTRLREALGVFDIVGLAGSRRRVPRQPGWGYVDERMKGDDPENFSGIVGHGPGYPSEVVSVFGPPGRSVKLLDGLFLAARSTRLLAKSVQFDERFDFHFYDLDFCRQAEQAGLTLGTWPISVVHESRGGYMSEGWRLNYDRYCDKWPD